MRSEFSAPPCRPRQALSHPSSLKNGADISEPNVCSPGGAGGGGGGGGGHPEPGGAPGAGPLAEMEQEIWVKVSKDYHFLIFNYTAKAYYWEVRRPPRAPRPLVVRCEHASLLANLDTRPPRPPRPPRSHVRRPCAARGLGRSGRGRPSPSVTLEDGPPRARAGYGLLVQGHDDRDDAARALRSGLRAPALHRRAHGAAGTKAALPCSTLLLLRLPPPPSSSCCCCRCS
jgi:hypothetical protein